MKKYNNFLNESINRLYIKIIHSDDYENLINGLIDLGTDINTPDEYGRTLLYDAILNGNNKDLIDFLLKIDNIDINYINPQNNNSIFDTVLDYTPNEIICLFLSKKHLNINKKQIVKILYKYFDNSIELLLKNFDIDLKLKIKNTSHFNEIPKEYFYLYEFIFKIYDTKEINDILKEKYPDIFKLKIAKKYNI